MQRRIRRTVVPTIGLALLLGTGACSAAQRGGYSAKAPGSGGAPESAVVTMDAASQANKSADSSTTPAQVKPQLIKTASIRLTVAEIDPAITKVRAILKQQQGDIYNFDDFRGKRGARRRVNLELKVPQANLDKTLAALGQLGNVLNTNVTSQDVTNQIVDTDARLKNLRKQEAMTQKLMERSGSLKDVLAVSNQLSQVREKIERLDAQVKRLRSQVAYSTINLQMSAAIAGGNVTNNSFGLQVKETWTRSTWGASQLIVGLLLFGVGLIPFLPFLLVLGVGIYLLQKLIRRRIRRKNAKRAAATQTN